MRFRSPVLAALALLLVLTGCGGSKGGKPKTTTTTTRFPPTRPVNNKQLSEGQGACGLLTSGEISSAVSAPAASGSGVETSGGESSCRWVLRNNAAQFVGIILTASDAKAYEERIQQIGSGVEQLPGVGERALLATDTAYVFKANKLMILSVSSGQAVAQRKAAATKLAQTAVGRL